MKRLLFTLLFCLAIAPAFAHGFGSLPFGGSGGGAVVGGDITLENQEVISNSTDGIICLEGAGQTNNEDICFNLEETANFIKLESNTGIADITVEDNVALSLGGGTSDLRMIWETEGNDNAQFAIRVGGGAGSGYLSLVERLDQGVANRSPSATSADPVFRVYSSDEAVATDYIELKHDQGAGILASGANLEIMPGNDVLDLKSNNDETIIRIDLDNDKDEAKFGLADDGGNQLVITNISNSANDHDHPLTTDPTLFIHSDTDPDLSNTQYASFAHDKVDFNITTGTGVINLNADVKTTGLLITATKSADPCTGSNDGAVFYNTSKDVLCFCGNGLDLEVSDGTACF